MNCFGIWGLFKLLPHSEWNFCIFFYFLVKSLIIHTSFWRILSMVDWTVLILLLAFCTLINTSYRIKVAIWFMIVHVLSDFTAFFNSLIMPDVILPVNLAVSWCAVSSSCGTISTLCWHLRLWSFLLCQFPRFPPQPSRGSRSPGLHCLIRWLFLSHLLSDVCWYQTPINLRKK